MTVMLVWSAILILLVDLVLVFALGGLASHWIVSLDRQLRHLESIDHSLAVLRTHVYRLVELQKASAPSSD
jgi:hypothetical protein